MELTYAGAKEDGQEGGQGGLWRGRPWKHANVEDGRQAESRTKAVLTITFPEASGLSQMGGPASQSSNLAKESGVG